MILADKIIQLRKKNGWSQEELADMLSVSRQSVSKWEGALSMPDLDKIIKLSQIFGVSTDYLLKEDIDTPDGELIDTYDESNVPRISLETANNFMSASKQASKRIALGVSICILSPVILLLLGAIAETAFPPITEDFAGGIGVVVLLIMVASATAIFITTSMQMNKFEYISKKVFDLEYGVAGIVENKKENFSDTFKTGITAGVTLCITSVIPLLLAAAFRASDFTMVICVDILLSIISIAVYIFIRVGMVQDSFNKLLQVGDFTEEHKKDDEFAEKIGGAYWLIITAIYLGCSFYTMQWDRTWIIWPCAGVLFGAIIAIVKLIRPPHNR